MSHKQDEIIERWVEAVCADEDIEATQELTFAHVRDSLPKVLASMAKMLIPQGAENFQAIDAASLEHGLIRAEQGFEPAEIAREYRILRSVIFSELESDLLRADAKDLFQVTRLIDQVVDEAIAYCFDSYTRSRMAEDEEIKAQMQLTNQELTRLVQDSQAGISQLTHELKTPLTSIIGYADLFLRQQQLYPEKTTTNLESVKRILRSGRLLLRLINDILQLQKNQGNIALNFGVVSPQDILQSVIEVVEPLLENKPVELQIDSNRSPQTVNSDPLRLQQIMINLLSNAVYYTPTGIIKVVLKTALDDQWSLVVSDSGIGISAEDQKRIFEPYFRVKGDAPRHENSTGLGLAIVAQLVELMQGEIQLSSQLGQGSTFTVIFPIEPV
ncbi:MAG: sensor histidine kinase [Leptolyngbyaceae cyanobacterium]